MSLAMRVVQAVVVAAMLAAVPARAQEAKADAPAKIQYKEDMGEVGALMVRSLLVMGGIFAVAWAGVYLLRRRGYLPPMRKSEGKSVRVVDSVRLGARSSLVVVQFEGERLLLAESDKGVSLVARKAAGEGEIA